MLAPRLDELDRLTASQTEIRTVVSDAMRFIAALPVTLREGVPQEKIGVLRQCVERMGVQDSRDKFKLTLWNIPTGEGGETAVVIVPRIPTE